jgi:erythromycin esterase
MTNPFFDQNSSTLKLIIYMLCLLAVCSSGYAQPVIKKFVKENRHNVRTVDPADTDYSDLEAIGNAIGDKRVVMLGEQDHGDAPAFLAKTRLIKYLREKKGFNVLAFESDFFGLTEGQQEIMNDTAALRKYLKGNIFSIWTYCDACTDLFYQYLPATYTAGRPMTVTGFDNQPHSRFSNRRLVKWLDSVITMERLPLDSFAAKKTFILNWTDSLVRYYGRKIEQFDNYDEMNRLMTQTIALHEGRYGKDFSWLILNSIAAFNMQMKYMFVKDYTTFTVRDAQMAANLNWLVNVKYKSEKVIVWAHNFHILNNSWAAMGRNAGKHLSMGNEFLKMPGNTAQTYVLGFTSGRGTAGRINAGKTYKVRKPRRNSFEKWIGNAVYAFVDFTSYNRQTAAPEFFLMKGKHHQQKATAQWTRCFDGMFYIRDMYACKLVQ